MSKREVVLLSSDNESIRVKIGLAQVSGVIRNLLETLGVRDEPIPMMRVNSKTLQLIFRWVKHHRHDTGEEWFHQVNPLENPANSPHIAPKDISKWDIKFFYENREHLGALIDAADYLHIPSLCHLLAKVIAMMMCCTNPPIYMDDDVEMTDVQEHDGEQPSVSPNCEAQ